MALRRIILLLMVAGCVYSYPSGAPSNICGRYVPGHRNMGTPVGNGPQTGPYSLTATQTGPGQYTVTLRSTTAAPFKGFAIMAIQSWKQLPDGPGDIVGMFQPNFGGQSQIRSCNTPGGSNVMTHTSSADKTVVEVNWRAPFNLPDPSVKFVATVVRDYDNFYVVHSPPVQVTDEFGTPAPAPTLSGNTASPFNNFPSVTSSGSGFSRPPVQGVTRRNDVMGGGLSVISNDLFDPTVSPINTPGVSVIFSMTDAPPPPIILPDGKVSSHGSVGTSNHASSSGSSSSASFVSSVDTSVISDRFNQSLPVPSSDSLSLISEPPSFISLISGGSSDNNSPSQQGFTVSPTQSFSTVTVRTFGSAPRPVMPTKPVTLVDTQTDTPLFEPINFADMRAPTPTVSASVEGIPVGLPTERTTDVNRTSTPLNLTVISIDEPQVEIINLPMLPEGQRAAVIDVVDRRRPEPSVIVDKLTGGTRRTVLADGSQGTIMATGSQGTNMATVSQNNGAVQNGRPTGDNNQGQGQGQMQGQGQFGQGQQTNQGFGQGSQAGQLGNRFGQQMNFGQRQQQFGMQGGRGQFGQRFGQGQMFGFQGNRPGQFGGRGGMPNRFPSGTLGGLNLPMNQLQGQSGFGGQQPGQNQNQFGGQQNGQQPGSTDTSGNQMSSSNIFGQFGTPNNQQNQGNAGQFGQTGFPGTGNPFQNNPFNRPGLNNGGRGPFIGFGQQQQQQGQFGRFGQFGNRGRFGNQARFGNQGRFGPQGQFGNQNFGQFNRGGMNRSPVDPRFGRNPFGPNQGQGQGGSNLNTFANVPSFGTGQQGFGQQNTLTVGGQQGQSSGNLFGGLSQPNDNNLNTLGNGQPNRGSGLMDFGNSQGNTGNGLMNFGNGQTNTNGQSNGQTSTNNQNPNNGNSGLSSFAFGPFTPNTK